MYEGITWHSAEQLFWYRMAVYNNDYESAEAIKVCVDGYEAKKLSYDIYWTQDDNDVKQYDIMDDVVMLKFSQDNDLGDRLIATKGTIYECTTEKGWGCGFTIANVDKITAENVKGNKMGKILMALREELKTW